jgi:hypothetical protein
VYNSAAVRTIRRRAMEPQIPTPEISQPSRPTDIAPKKRILWKWSIAVTLVVIAVLFWRCGTGLIQGRQLSASGVQQFHSLLNSGHHEQIYDGASDAFRNGGSKEDLIKFFQSIHRKLGDAGPPTLNSLNVSATPTGTYITAVYRTTFMEGEAVETFTWLKSGQGVVLNGYNIQSMKLIVE